ncbi:uncharacterized protein MONBRDRAFT_37889 [Monosiga brevicollis MX1]|uniref:Phosphoglycerate dehydrogenase n=1 Tax=Monosiga brevicollis TaxID=81824 RepID=A9V4F4_MONBE|nr:uncharacterized protein MONBRDRAFT_37889 [Monosiga brevicollis MX1]EDQ87605.1 predicted protein [Monosiga brevicollis MX1]|eukprot:XP_001747525.1 hypothetical protein [Monosiga brevicollis MX1]
MAASQRSDPSSINVLLMEKISTEAVKTFQAEGFTVRQAVKYSEEELVEAIKDVHIIGVRSKTKLPARVLDAATKLTAIGCFCIGTDQTDLKHAASKGIPVFNAPYANTRSVSELVIAEIIMLARQAGDRSMEIHQGEWNKKSDGCYEVRGKTLGIIGYGHVGSQLSVLAESLGLKMKTGSYLINAARGSCVDIEHVAAALRSGHLAGAAIDVYPKEPAGHTKEWVNVLQGCPNTILTPHIGGSTEEAQASIGREVATKIIAYMDRGSTLGAVNVPEINISARLDEGHSRVVSFHQNTPGVLRDINNIISIANIKSQQLLTNDEVGYLVVDLETVSISEVKEKLEQVPHNIRLRLLFRGPGYVALEPSD